MATTHEVERAMKDEVVAGDIAQLKKDVRYLIMLFEEIRNSIEMHGRRWEHTE